MVLLRDIAGSKTMGTKESPNADNDSIEDKKRIARKLSIYEASAYSVSDGFGLRNIAPYAIALNASNSAIGFLTSIPSLLANLSQLMTYRLLGRYTRKKIVLFSVFVQTFFWLLMIIPGILFLRISTGSDFPAIILIAMYTGLVLSGAIAGPAWSSWMKDIVPKEELGRYFAKRSKIAGTISFCCMILAGIVLDYFKKTEVLYGFFILLFFSFLFRGISGFLFTKKYEPEFRDKKESYFGFFQFLYNMPFNNFGRFVLFISLLNFSIAVASPFFAVYLLKDRAISYTIYMALLMLTPLSGIFVINYWGRLSDTIGNVKIMKIAGIFIVSIPFFYYLSSLFTNPFLFFGILIFIEVIAGVNWAGFNLAVSNFLFKTVSREKLVLCSSYMNLLNGFGVFIGATLGGAIASLDLWNPIILVFLISGFGRLIVYLFILPKIKESVNEQSKYDRKDFISPNLLLPRFFNQIEDLIYFRRRKIKT